jgi:hypothetical protein
MVVESTVKELCKCRWIRSYFAPGTLIKGNFVIASSIILHYSLPPKMITLAALNYT